MTGRGFCVAGSYVCISTVEMISEWKLIFLTANALMSQYSNTRVVQQNPMYHNDNDYPDLCILSLSHGCCHSNTSMSYQVRPL